MGDSLESRAHAAFPPPHIAAAAFCALSAAVSAARERNPLVDRSIKLPIPDAPTSELAVRFPDIQTVCLDDLYRTNATAADSLLSYYYPAYKRAFPDRDERLDLKTLSRIISDPTNTWDIAVFLERNKVVGGYHTLLGKLGRHTISLGDYLWVAKEYRGQGLSAAIYRDTIEARRQIGAVAHFGEINDPALMTPEQIALDQSAGVDPNARMSFWAKMGRQAVNAPWTQPALRKDSEEVDHLLLSVHCISDQAPTCVSRADYLQLWRTFYEPLQSNGTLDRAFKRLQEQLGKTEEIGFIPLGSTRDFIEAGKRQQ